MVHTMKSQATGTTRERRQHDRTFKDDLVEQMPQPGASVWAIALKYGINANLLFKWRRDHVRAHGSSGPQAATLLPGCVIPEGDRATRVQSVPAVAQTNRTSRP